MYLGGVWIALINATCISVLLTKDTQGDFFEDNIEDITASAEQLVSSVRDGTTTATDGTVSKCVSFKFLNSK